VAPRDLVVSLLPQPKDLAGRMRGKTCVGLLARGIADGEERSYYIYNVADHEAAYADLGVQATAWQTGIPPVLAAVLMAQGDWFTPGVKSPEELNPDPFLELMPAYGMDWHIRDELTGEVDTEVYPLAVSALAA
jgi:saccharopine dehydrogenase (NAD+, L-lysine-forming)